MFNPSSETIPGEEKVKAIPKARTLALVLLAGYIMFVLLYLCLWELNPEWQVILNRLSWSSSDFVGVGGVAIGLYSYWLVEKYNKNANIAWLNEFVLELKKAGLKPENVGAMLELVKPMMKEAMADPEFGDRLMRVATRIAKERIDGLKKLNDQELYEVLRSG